jgi:hypothetical protein
MSEEPQYHIELRYQEGDILKLEFQAMGEMPIDRWATREQATEIERREQRGELFTRAQIDELTIAPGYKALES